MKALKIVGLVCAGMMALFSLAAFADGAILAGIVVLLFAAGVGLTIWFAKPPEKGCAKEASAQNRAAFRAIAEEQHAKGQAIRDRIAAAEEAGLAYCPKCGSTSLSANKKGFGVGKAVVGAWAVGPIGLTAGNIGRQKVLVTCLNCGHQFKPGKK